MRLIGVDGPVVVTPIKQHNHVYRMECGGAAFFRGTSLGAAPAANVANVLFAAPPTLIGGGGAAGTTNISILPWGIGNTSATAPQPT